MTLIIYVINKFEKNGTETIMRSLVSSKFLRDVHSTSNETPRVERTILGGRFVTGDFAPINFN